MVGRHPDARSTPATFPRAPTPNAVFRILLTAMHGAAAMRLCDRLAQGEDADALARDTLEAALPACARGSDTSISFDVFDANSEERPS